MALEHVPRCQHVKVNGVQCNSPALRNKAHCFFHTRAEYERKLACEERNVKRTFGFPLLEDANSIQVALMKIIQMLGAGTLDHKTASLMLYALQTASYNLRQTKFEPEKVTDMVIDEDTVDLTRIQGPQWSARDFPPSAPAEVQNLMKEDLMKEDLTEEDLPSEPEEEPEELPATARPAAHAGSVNSATNQNPARVAPARTPAPVVDPIIADIARRREQKRRLQRERDIEQAIEDEPDSLAAVLLKRMGLPLTDEEDEERRGIGKTESRV